VKDEHGTSHTVQVCETMFFPAGSSAEWTVKEYVRKVAFLRYPMAPQVVLVYRIFNKLKRMLGRGGFDGGAKF
jgi:hypothetical protein